MSDIVERLRDEEWRGPMQHLRGWDELDALHDDAAAEIERLRAALLDASRELGAAAAMIARLSREPPA